MKELCAKCAFQNECWFYQRVQDVVSKVPPLKQHTVINNPNNFNPTEEAFTAHKEIESLRKTAREEYNCPNVNDINPDYPGRKNL